ncbi:MAG: hypothetical protein CVU56_15365 [Deltaproteobacteria bacterium HGW-Deltaproteobacteria-14]|jgi:hypothetical protein|nr:MAG: hypothetical protein CVU56_15365 [Deltaproteobacteria bacterium HGW-Deltaproteobacteria-14]
MTAPLTKEQKRQLRELNGLAYERELAAELTKLEVEFARWRAGEVTPFDLERTIHVFHQGPARELYTRYDGSMSELMVASAIDRGVLSEEEAGPEAIGLLADQLAAIRKFNE